MPGVQTCACRHRFANTDPSTATCRWMSTAPLVSFAFWQVVYHGYVAASFLPQMKQSDHHDNLV